MKVPPKLSVVRIMRATIIASAALAAAGMAFIDHTLKAGIREQQQMNAARRPFVNAVANRIPVGEAVEFAALVLERARVTYIDDKVSRQLATNFRTGPGSGIQLVVRYDEAQRVSTVEISEGVTSL